VAITQLFPGLATASALMTSCPVIGKKHGLPLVARELRELVATGLAHRTKHR
jgi:hypothetical protein